MEYLKLLTIMALWIISDAKYIDPSCVVKVSDSVHDAVFSHNHELSLRLWVATPSQPTNFTIRVPSQDPDVAQTLPMKIDATQNDTTTWKYIEIRWPRPASNLSIFTAGTGQKVDKNPWTTSSPDTSSSQESNSALALHITSDRRLIWLNTNPNHLKEDNCQEAVHIVNYLLVPDELIPSYTSDVVRLSGPDGNSREYDERTAVIVILASFLIVALLSLVVICCYIRQHTPQSKVQYEAVNLGGPEPWRDGTLSNVTEVTEEISQQH